MGVRILLNAKVTSIRSDESPSSSTTVYLSDQRSIEEVAHVVITAGPWSRRVLEELFPAAQVEIPMDTLASSGNHLIVRTPRWRPSHDRKCCDQLFLDGVIGRPLDIISRPGGTLYIGYGAEPEELPTLATDVKPQEKAIDRIKELCIFFLDIPEGEELEVVEAGRCYRSVMKHPIIAEIPVSLLSDPSEPSPRCRVFLNVGHGSYGITLGPGSGKVMSEIILGIEPSANVSGLGYE
jgi:glycine/D-amino acid oxidase-like deaminating enzyme